MADLPDDVRKALEGANFWHLATVNPDGSPQSTTVWAGTRDGKIIVNSALGRKKPRNIEREPRVALSWHTHEGGGYKSISIQGKVVETITGEQADRDIDDFAEKYLGQRPYPWRSPGEQRVTFVIEPVKIHTMG
ncbi:MAG TPA: TIGR03618 family F420-dependent PPOX class oxidoreductase [Gaiellaceae bacterium]|nr:TIGR03618 family F420-dependent PPOX class oxidoreductase [Gaiellaceae bacterium]HZT54107.1 TIGR03618 family F420-dependent PPOX class oxidoreductase [Gaiellaceae bacterium]